MLFTRAMPIKHGNGQAAHSKKLSLLLHRYRSEAVAVVRGLSDEQLERTVMSPLDNVRVSVQQMVEGMTDHPRAHLASLRATVSRQNVER